ncbi:MAG TPA: hypothetical protein VKU38_01440, partial [Ktedonobacteraceae bacterium]|nr:hypothetical protein [Ktedonobacteraceae bacterium]
MSLPTRNTATHLDHQTRHPLDPLSEEEIAQTTRILMESGRISARTRLMAYTLQEPPKDDVLTYQPGQTVPRAVFVVMRDHERRVTVEALVDLNATAIRSWRERTDVQPALTYPEVFAAAEAILADSTFQEALAKRQITDLASVVVYPWTAGYRSPEDAPENGRFIRMEVALSQGAEDNYYAHPVEGIVATVEL